MGPGIHIRYAKQVLGGLIRPNSTVLVKASRGMRLEELTAVLKDLTREE